MGLSEASLSLLTRQHLVAWALPQAWGACRASGRDPQAGHSSTRRAWSASTRLSDPAQGQAVWARGFSHPSRWVAVACPFNRVPSPGPASERVLKELGASSYTFSTTGSPDCCQSRGLRLCRTKGPTTLSSHTTGVSEKSVLILLKIQCSNFDNLEKY